MKRTDIKVSSDKKPRGKPWKYKTEEERKEAIKASKRKHYHKKYGGGKNCREDYRQVKEMLSEHSEHLKKLERDIYEIKQALWQNSLNGGSK